jgi:GNAT superfamily N-acetyltransferase
MYAAHKLPETYKPMIFSKWMRSTKYGNEYFKAIDSNVFYTVYQKYIEQVLSRPIAMVRLATLSDDADNCLGWSIVEGSTLHYIHVEWNQRNQGIGKSLLPPDGIRQFTHLTKTGMKIWNNEKYHGKYSNAIFNPFT